MNESITSDADTESEIEATETPPEIPKWFHDDRVTVTPEHFEIEVYSWAPPAKKLRKRLEDENPDNRPPNKVRVRRKFFAGDAIKLDDYPGEGQSSQNMALACILTGLDFDMMKRMDYQDYRFVLTAVIEVTEGKELGAGVL